MYRPDVTVFHRAVDDEEWRALHLASAGCPLAAVGEELGRLLGRWLDYRLLTVS